MGGGVSILLGVHSLMEFLQEILSFIGIVASNLYLLIYLLYLFVFLSMQTPASAPSIDLSTKIEEKLFLKDTLRSFEAHIGRE